MNKFNIILLIIIAIAVIIFAVPILSIFVLFALTIPFGMIYSFNAEGWLNMHGIPFSYIRGFKNGLRGIFYINNYYYDAFGTYSLDIYNEVQIPEISSLIDEEDINQN